MIIILFVTFIFACGGFGLGLNICYGTIHTTSEVNQGTTFTIKIPIKITHTN